MIAWMLYSAVVALIIAASARAAESLAQLAGYRVRWIWSGAIALTAFLSASAAWHGAPTAAPASMAWSRIAAENAMGNGADESWRGPVFERLEEFRHALDRPLQSAVASLDRAASPAVNVYAGSTAVAISLAFAFVFVAVGGRFRRARRQWPRANVEGVDVLIAPQVGPLVVGIVRPQIVVPRWLLGRDPGDQRLVVAHEHEHVRARDPLLLGVATGAVILAPWNPAVWYMVSRLRLAIELDCDARVLRRGAIRQSYGSLLIDVAQRASELRLSALALADDASQLHQRLLAMNRKPPRFARARGGAAAVFALVTMLVACQASLPASPKLAVMEEASTTTAHVTRHLPRATQAEAPARAPNKIVRRETANGAAGKRTDKSDAKPRSPSHAVIADSSSSAILARTEAAPVSSDDGGNATSMLGARAKPPFTGMIFIDGVRSTMDQLQTVPRQQIDAIEVIKGASAAQEFNDPEAAKGVIVVRTKKVD